MTTFITGRGGVQAWECDENEHLNVQFYAARVSDAAPFVLDALGIGPSSGLALVPAVHHTRFLRELRMGDITVTRSTPVAMGPATVTLLHELTSDDGVGARFIATDRLIDTQSGATVAWPPEAEDALRAAIEDLPDAAQPRTLALDQAAPLLNLAEAEADGWVEIHRGPVTPQQCDILGTIAPQHVIGRFSDGVPHLWAALGLDRRVMLDRGRGSVVLETKLTYLKRPRPGDLLVGRSALIAILGKAVRFQHVLFDKRGGEPVAINEAVATTLDLAARKAVGFDEAEKAALQAHVKTPGTSKGA